LDISGNQLGDLGKTAIGLGIIRAELPLGFRHLDYSQELGNKVGGVGGGSGGSGMESKECSSKKYKRKTMFLYPDLQDFTCDDIATKKIDVKKSAEMLKGGGGGGVVVAEDLGMFSAAISSETIPSLSVLDLSQHSLVSSDLFIVAGALFRNRQRCISQLIYYYFLLCYYYL
jgi:hypothetical protein